MQEFSDPKHRTIDDAELRELVQRLSATDTAPTVADVAEALGVEEARVDAILTEMRQTPVAVPITPPIEVPNNKRRQVIVWAIVAALLLLTGMLMLMVQTAPVPLPPAHEVVTPVIAH